LDGKMTKCALRHIVVPRYIIMFEKYKEAFSVFYKTLLVFRCN
jgi:hypothetical protein